MYIPFNKYANIKDRCCIRYLGHAKEYILLLNILKPQIEQQLPGLIIHIMCRDEFKSYFKEDYVIPECLFKDCSERFGLMFNLDMTLNKHCIMTLFEQSDLKIQPITKNIDLTHHCMICSEGTTPTRSLNNEEIRAVINYVERKGYSWEITEDTSGKGLAIGVESYGLFKAAAEGLKTQLIPTGIGTDLYKALFPVGEIIEMNNIYN